LLQQKSKIIKYTKFFKTLEKMTETWLTVLNNVSLNESTRSLAANFINNRIAYYYNVSRIIKIYFDAHGVKYRKSANYTWHKCADLLYAALLRKQ